MAKQLSNGTRALKFMQRKTGLPSQTGIPSISAEKPVELIRAAIVDDSAWERKDSAKVVGEASQDGESSAKASIVYEASYLPFLSGSVYEDREASEEDAAPRMINGRWTNMKKPEAKTTILIAPPIPNYDTTEDIPTSAPAAKLSTGSVLTARISKPSQEPKTANHKGKRRADDDADIIIQDVGYGSSTGMVSSDTKPTKPTHAAATPGFLRPKGIDSPSGRSSQSEPASKVERLNEGSSQAITAKPKKKKRKLAEEGK